MGKKGRGTLDPQGCSRPFPVVKEEEQNASAGKVLAIYSVVRTIASALNIRIGGVVQFVRPLVLPMAQAAGEQVKGEKFDNDEEEKIIGLLHDLLEDTKVTIEELKEMGFSSFVLETLKLLTRNKAYSYDEYIDQIINSHNESALYIKKIDLEHNMDFTRCPNLDEATREKLQKKYTQNYSKICAALKKVSKESKS